MLQAKLKVGTSLKSALSAFEADRALIVRTTVLFAVLNAASAPLNVAGAGLAISIGLAVLLGAAYGGLVTATVCLPGKSEGLGDLWVSVRPVLAKLIWVTLVSAVMVLAGLFALVIPAFVIVTFIAVAGQVVVVERSGVFEAISRSINLVKGNAWRVFGYLLVIGLVGLAMLAVAMVVGAPLGTGTLGDVVRSFLSNLLSAPVLAVGSAVLYNQLSAIRQAAETEGSPEEPGSEPPL